MGSSKKDKSQVTVTTPPPSQAEQDAQKQSQSANEIQMYDAGYVPNYDVNGNFYKWDKRPLTADEQKRQDQENQLYDLAYKKLTGQISEEDRALVEQEYQSASTVGRSNIEADFNRALAGINTSENRTYEDIQKELQRGTEDINQSFTQGAAERGLGQGDTPILGERAKAFQRFGQDVSTLTSRTAEDASKNKTQLGEDYARNLSNFETSLSGAKAASMLDVGQKQQLFAQASREFSAQLQQQAFQNRQLISDAYNQTALGLGNLRSRNITQTSSGGSSSSNPSQIAGAAGGLLQGAGSFLGSSTGQSMMSGIGSLFSSSRKFKEHIQPLDVDQLLEKLDSTPIYAWQYKGIPYRHIGPMTEEAPPEIVNGDVLVAQDYLGFLFGSLKALSERVKRLEKGN